MRLHARSFGSAAAILLAASLAATAAQGAGPERVTDHPVIRNIAENPNTFDSGFAALANPRLNGERLQPEHAGTTGVSDPSVISLMAIDAKGEVAGIASGTIVQGRGDVHRVLTDTTFRDADGSRIIAFDAEGRALAEIEPVFQGGGHPVQGRVTGREIANDMSVLAVKSFTGTSPEGWNARGAPLARVQSRDLLLVADNPEDPGLAQGMQGASLKNEKGEIMGVVAGAPFSNAFSVERKPSDFLRGMAAHNDDHVIRKAAGLLQMTRSVGAGTRDHVGFAVPVTHPAVLAALDTGVLVAVADIDPETARISGFPEGEGLSASALVVPVEGVEASSLHMHRAAADDPEDLDLD